MKCLQINRRIGVTLAAATVAAWGLGGAATAHADGYPAKPVQLVVPFPPGGAVDMVGRLISKKLDVPYRGSAPAMSDLIGGQIPFTIDTVAAALPQLKGGKVTMADAEIRSKLVASGLEQAYAPGDAVQAQIEDELPRMRAIAQRANIRAE